MGRQAERFGAVLVSAVAGLSVAAVPTPARAEDPQPLARSAATTYQVTFVARACPGYADVMANQARDDAAESPGRPGKDSGYKPGQAVDPEVEARVDCAPLPGTRFTLGAGREKKGALSTVTAPAEPVVTTSQAPRLDAWGKPTGGQLAGAVTVALTEDQLRLAARRQLWVQGGAPGVPLPGGHSFGVLRCGIDGRTGGNTQWIAFPARTRHVFCFAYYVRGGAATGTFTLKVRTTRPVGYPQRLPFASTLSQAGTFVLAAETAEASVVRLAGEAHRLEPKLPAGWRVADLSCAGSRITTDAGTGRADVTLAAGENAFCAYSVEPPAVPAGLTLRAYSEGGGANFGITVAGGGREFALSAAPKGDGSAVAASGASLAALPGGAYTVTVRPPAADAAQWSLAGAACNGSPVAVQGWALSVTVSPGVPTECALRLARKQGAVGLSAVTAGGVAAAGFALVPADGAAPGWGATATTAKAGTPVRGAGDVPAALPAGGYLLLPIPPLSTVEGSWRLTGLGCQPGNSAGADATVVRIDLTASSTVECTASYERVPAIRLALTVTAHGGPDARGGPTAVEVSCADGSTGRAVLGAKDAISADLPEPLTFAEKTNCTVGLAEDAPRPLTSSLTVEPAPGNAPIALPVTVSLEAPGTEYRLTATLTYGDGDDDDDGQRAGALGSFTLLPFALIGSGLVGVGAMILLVLVARRRMGLE